MWVTKLVYLSRFWGLAPFLVSPRSWEGKSKKSVRKWYTSNKRWCTERRWLPLSLLGLGQVQVSLAVLWDKNWTLKKLWPQPVCLEVETFWAIFLHVNISHCVFTTATAVAIVNGVNPNTTARLRRGFMFLVLGIPWQSQGRGIKCFARIHAKHEPIDSLWHE
jgi:hypothetical protein